MLRHLQIRCRVLVPSREVMQDDATIGQGLGMIRLGGKDKVDMFEMNKHLAKHLS